MTYVKENHVSLREMIDELNLELKPIDYKKFDEEGGIQAHLYNNYDVVNEHTFYELAEELWNEAKQDEKEGYTEDEYISEAAFDMMYGSYQYFKIPKEQVEIWSKYTVNPTFKHDKKDEYITGFGHFGTAWYLIGTNMTKEQLIAIKNQ